MSEKNILRCKHCHWQTTKWGPNTTLDQAWLRLRQHIRGDHPEFDDRLDQHHEDCTNHEAEYIRSLHLNDGDGR